jgi:hypothetical protein
MGDDLTKQLKRDADGNVLMNPVSEFLIGPVGDISVLLVLKYLQENSRTSEQAIQLSLMPQQALDLAEKLKKWGSILLESRNQSERPPN